MTAAAGKTIGEKILSSKSGTDARAGDVVVCGVDLVIGTDASTPMTIGYFEKMGGERLFDASRVVFSLDHYSPPSTPKTAAFHDRIRAFARRYGATVFEVGEGISHQVAPERGRVLPGDLVIGADSHTVTVGALNAFAVGLGSSDIAAALITGRTWLRVPETIRVVLTGERAPALAAKDVGLAMIAALGSEGANYQALEFHGPSVGAFTLDERMVLSNLSVEAGAKAAVWNADATTNAYLSERVDGWTAGQMDGGAVHPDSDASYSRELRLDLATLSPRVAVPHDPTDVVNVADAAGTPVHMVFLGTCTGGRVSDFHEAVHVLERAGGRIAPGVQLVVTPASREVLLTLVDDGTLARLTAMGAIVTTPGCGACCGTSGAIPGDGMNVLSTANRNFKARMGNAAASIYLASPATCAASAATGRITDPREIG
ncbi:MAG TPA: aconitase/3-isopropylmalate dehydratase large subunit family protein [Gemmatimonadaceae bacterium]|jgi:3-isopropylmalate/(R)-2-methylmalate dehydratase large subunit